MKGLKEERLMSEIDKLVNDNIVNSRAALAKSIGKSVQYFTDIVTGKQKAQDDIIEKIAEKYNIDKEYILIGKIDRTFQDNLRDKKLNSKRGEVPLISQEEAFVAAESELIAPTDPVYYDPNRQTINIGDFLSDSTAAMPVYGNSMMPNYPSGCIVGLKSNNNNFFEPGEVYVFEHNGRRILKRLFYKDDNPDSDFIMCYSDNTMKFEGGARSGKLAYPPFYVNKNDIDKIYPVTGVIKRNINANIISKM